MNASQFVAMLDEKVAGVAEQIVSSEVVTILCDENTSKALVAAIVRNILLDVHCYGPSITAAVASAIGRLSDKHHLIRPLMQQLLEEVSHPHLAFRSFVALGGDPSIETTVRPSPAAFAVGAVVTSLASSRCPLNYLGYVYLLEGTTATIAERFRVAMENKGLAADFVTLHAIEDVQHAADVRGMIEQVTTQYPETADEIDYAFDCFASVYPHPVWSLALARARDEVKLQR